MTIDTDFTIDYVNKRIWNKYAWGQGGTVTTYTVNALYSWLMDVFDAQGMMDDDVPMSAQTPNAYSLINGWFIDDETTKYLYLGAITTVRGDTVISMITFQASGYTSAIFSDITKQVIWDAADKGALLAYDNTRRIWWVRTTTAISPPEAITINGGTGLGTATAEDSTGEDLYANLYTLGTIESGTQIYIYQAGSKINGWWSTGHIDVIVKVKEYGTEIDNANVTVYARVYTDLYDYFAVDLGSGGRNAVPLATSNDLDNQVAIATALSYLEVIKIGFVNGTITFTGASGDAAVAYKCIHGATSHATALIANTTSPFTLLSIEGTFQNSETIEILEEVKFDTLTDVFDTLGQVITSGSAGTGTLRRVQQDPQGVGVKGILFLSGVSGTFANEDSLTGATDGIAVQDGAIATNTFSATTSSTVTFADTFDKDLNNPNGLQPYNVLIYCASQTVEVLYELLKGITQRTSTFQCRPTNGSNTVYVYNGEFYQTADTTFTQIKKASPFGTFAGGKFFGARGVWIESVAGADSESYSLIDALNATEDPPTSSALVVVSCRPTDDRVLVCESTGTGLTTIKKNQYTLTSQNNQSYIEVSGAIADDAPTTGVVRVVVDYGLSTEHEDIYNYTSINRAPANDQFILASPTGQTYDSADKAYNPYIDGLADGSGEVTISLKYSGSTKYIVTRVRLKAWVPFQVAGSFASGTTTITAIRTADGIYTP